MSAMAARQCAAGLSIRRATSRQFQSSASRAVTVGHTLLHRPSTSVRSLYGPKPLGIAQAARGFSLWTGSSTAPLAAAYTEPSPDAVARDTPVPEAINLSSANNTSDTLSTIESSMSDATEKVQTLADLGQLSSWYNVRYAQELLDWMVEATGLPWWATIALVTVGVRIAVLPIVFKGQANAIRLANINPQMQRKMKDIQYAKSVGDTRLLQESAVFVQKLMKDNNCSPLKSFIAPAVQMPVFISFFFALKGLAVAELTSMKTGGLSWFTDLTLADPYAVLPVVSAAMTLAVIETGAEMGGGAQNANSQAKVFRNILRGATVFSIPLLWSFPAAVFCFWATNNTFSLLQLVVLQIPVVRKALKLPEKITPKDEDLPKEKPLGFWDSVSAGKASQEKVKASIQKNHIPSALQQRKSMEDSREAALQRIISSQGSEQSVSSSTTRDGVSVLEEENVLQSQRARDDEKNRRVEMARKKRAKR